MTDSTCSIEGCDQRPHARGWCPLHYNRWRRHGDPLGTHLPPLVADRIIFYGWTETQTGCWEWQGPRDVYGYGQLIAARKHYKVHRLVYERFVGPIPQDHVVRHTCDNPPCVNPEHLLTGTQRDNIRDAVERKRHGFGERSGMAKLIDADVLQIRNLRRQGWTQAAIADRYDIDQSTVSLIVNHKLWAHLEAQAVAS